MSDADVLVVGGSVAGSALVSELRSGGFAGRIVVLDHDTDGPYDRPPLSKGFLAEKTDRPELLETGEDYVRVAASAVSLDLDNRRVSALEPGRGQPTDFTASQIVLATGAASARPAGLPRGVLGLRSAADARRIREHIRMRHRFAILGAGTIGTELASSAVAAGCLVTLLDLAPRPLDRFLGGHLGSSAERWIRDDGVDLRLSTAVKQVDRADSGWRLRCEGGGELEADVVIAAVGSKPATDWLTSSGLAAADGIACSSQGRVRTPDGRQVEGVFAVGDVACWQSSRGTSSRRREDWTSAGRQGRHVAATILGRSSQQPYDSEPDYFWSHQFGRRVQVLGRPCPSDELSTISDNPARHASFHELRREGRAIAWIAINSPRDFALKMRESAVSVR